MFITGSIFPFLHFMAMTADGFLILHIPLTVSLRVWDSTNLPVGVFSSLHPGAARGVVMIFGFCAFLVVVGVWLL
jgi:hypothetical protein